MKRLTCVALLSVTTAACTGGERNVTGDCPADEECSTLTPNGMHFTGVPLVGLPLFAQPKITAVGGTQSIELYTVLDNDDIVPLDLPFAAMTDNGDALSILSTGPNAVVLSGDASGRDLLRITEPDNDLLYDRYEVEAQALDHVELVAATSETYDLDGTVGFYTGDLEFGLALYSAAGERLADDSLTLTFPGPQPVRSEWDTFELASIGPGTLTGTLVVAGDSGPLALDVVDAIDTVLPLSDTFNDTIHSGDQAEVCFHAAVDAGPDSVLGLPWVIEPTAGQVTQLISLSPNCIALQVTAAGTFTITATALGVSTAISFTAVAAAGKPAPAPDRTPQLEALRRGLLGERARMLVE